MGVKQYRLQLLCLHFRCMIVMHPFYCQWLLFTDVSMDEGTEMCPFTSLWGLELALLSSLFFLLPPSLSSSGFLFTCLLQFAFENACIDD